MEEIRGMEYREQTLPPRANANQGRCNSTTDLEGLKPRRGEEDGGEALPRRLTRWGNTEMEVATALGKSSL